MPRRNKREDYLYSLVKPSKLRYERRLRGSERRKKRFYRKLKGGESK